MVRDSKAELPLEAEEELASLVSGAEVLQECQTPISRNFRLLLTVL